MTDWQPFAAAVKDATGGNTKIQLRKYVEVGSIPIIDQGKSLIGGYTNDLAASYSGPIPCIVFGDHTRIFKYIDFPFALGADGVKILVPHLENLDTKFLYHYLASQKLPVAGYSRHFKFLKDIRIPVASLEEQRHIVAVLDRAAAIRRRADAARAKARAIIPALFLDMFGDPANNPKGWPMAAVGELVDSASYGTSQKATETSAGLPVIRMGNVTMDGQLDTADLKFVKLAESDWGKAELREGDLLFNRTNSKDLVGKTGLWDGRFEAVAASYFIRLRLQPERVVPAYLWAFFNSSHMKRVLFQTARGAIGQANINAKELRAFLVAVPPLPLQAAFAEQAQRIEGIARAIDAAAAKAAALAASLSAEVFG